VLCVHFRKIGVHVLAELSLERAKAAVLEELLQQQSGNRAEVIIRRSLSGFRLENIKRSLTHARSVKCSQPMCPCPGTESRQRGADQPSTINGKTYLRQNFRGKNRCRPEQKCSAASRKGAARVAELDDLTQARNEGGCHGVLRRLHYFALRTTRFCFCFCFSEGGVLGAAWAPLSHLRTVCPLVIQSKSIGGDLLRTLSPRARSYVVRNFAAISTCVHGHGVSVSGHMIPLIPSKKKLRTGRPLRLLFAGFRFSIFVRPLRYLSIAFYVLFDTNRVIYYRNDKKLRTGILVAAGPFCVGMRPVKG